MIVLTPRRYALALALLLAAVPAGFGIQGEQPERKLETFFGKVKPLAEALNKQDVKLDVDAAGVSMVLVADDGKIFPLIKDDGSRMFFMDKACFNRPMRLTGRLVPQSQLIQVIYVHSVVDGKLHDVFYWCDICTIRDNEPGLCHCCGAPFEFRELPLK